MLRTCFSTAPSVTTRARAMAVLERPSAIRASTSRSRGVSSRSGSSRRRRTSSWPTTSGSSTVPPAATRASASRNSSIVGHPVLEQVADPAAAGPAGGGQQVVGVRHLDVLGEHQDRRTRHQPAGLHGGAQPLVGVRRRHPDVDDRHVRPVASTTASTSASPSPTAATTSCPLLGEQPHQPLPEQYGVVRDHHPHGAVVYHVRASASRAVRTLTAAVRRGSRSGRRPG